MASLRRNPCFVAASGFLASQGYSFTPAWGAKHPYVLIDMGDGRTLRFAFPGTASCSRSANNVVRDLKRMLATRGTA